MRERTSAQLHAHDSARYAAKAFVSLLRLFVVLGAGVLLTSLAGAAVYAAPITVPLLVLVAVTSRGRGWSVAATVVAALTFLEVAWMLTWVSWRNAAGSFAVGLVAALALTCAFWSTTRPARFGGTTRGG